MKREEMQLPLLEFAEEIAINGTPQEKAYLRKGSRRHLILKKNYCYTNNAMQLLLERFPAKTA